jgi:protein-disulfide isomerase
VGAPAPEFDLHSTPDQTVKLMDFRGHPVVLAFYPADWSAHARTERPGGRRRQGEPIMSSGILQSPVGPADHYLGSADAPLVLVEYGDYECPHCGRAHQVLQSILPALAKDVRFVFRNFPLAEAHPHAEPAAEAAESVAAHGGNDAFWAMHDLLFEKQDALEPEDLLAYAKAAGVDPALVASDLAAGAMTARVRADFKSGVRSGVNGTPTFFVNGRRFDGNWSDPATFTAALRAARAASR